MAPGTRVRLTVPHMVALGLTGMGAGLLSARAARTFGPDRFGTLEPLAGWFVVLVVVVTLAAAVAIVRAPGWSRWLLLAAIVGTIVGDLLPTAPPRNLALLPLTLAAGLMFTTAGRDRDAATRAAPQPPLWVAVGWLGIALHAGVGWLYLASGLVAPLYGVLVLWALWTVLLVVALRLRRDRPAWTPFVAVVAAVLWFLVLSLGEVALGWQP